MLWPFESATKEFPTEKYMSASKVTPLTMILEKKRWTIKRDQTLIRKFQDWIL
jgi:hypothetical protein